MSVRETVKSLFRSSKTVDNMCSTAAGNNQLSYSQPIVTESSMMDNLHFESPMIGHSEQTPLIDRRNESKRQRHSKASFDGANDDGNNDVRLNRHGLHLPLDPDGLQRSRSCTDDIIMPIHHEDITDLLHGTAGTSTVPSNLQTNHSEVVSLRSSDSTGSSLSAFLPSQPLIIAQLSAPPQMNAHGRNEITKSEESLLSLPSPVQKQHSFKSLMTAASTQDTATKQSNDVLFLIANWVMRSPEDFQGKGERVDVSLVDLFSFSLAVRLSRAQGIEEFLRLARIVAKLLSQLDEPDQGKTSHTSNATQRNL